MGVVVDSYRFAAAGPAFDPTDIAGLDFWIDVSDASTVTFGTGSNVAQLDDKSGNSYHWTQATGSAQPDRDVTQNGLSAVNFDGSAEFISNTSNPSAGAPKTIFCVFRRAASGATYLAAGPDTGIGFYLNGSGVINIDRQSQANVYGAGNGAGTIAAGAWHVISATITTTAAAVWVDGVADTTSSYSSTFGGSGFGWGAGRPDGSFKGTGDMGEVLAYNSVLGTSDRQDVEAYLATKWGL